LSCRSFGDSEPELGGCRGCHGLGRYCDDEDFDQDDDHVCLSRVVIFPRVGRVHGEDDQFDRDDDDGRLERIFVFPHIRVVSEWPINREGRR